MSYQVLARKWRPQSFNDVVGQKHIVRSLKNSIIEGKSAQSYLLTGTRGVGKTTLARILAKAIRCQDLDNGNPCLKCPSCLDFSSDSSMDIQEVDGASNNSVENVRDIISSVQYLPVSGKYRVFIIDEVHMLSTSAFNALLKTLEEPPAHVIFIFATTDPQKIPQTVLSRVQRFDLLPLKKEQLVAHLKYISEKEEIIFESLEDLDVLATKADGSVRDMLSALDQVLLSAEGKNISSKALRESLGIIENDLLEVIIDSMFVGDIEKVHSLISSVFERDIILDQFVVDLTKNVFHKLENAYQGKNQTSLDLAELQWVFETLSHELTKAIESFTPELFTQAVIYKVTKRHELLSALGVGEDRTPVEKKTNVDPIVEKQELNESPIEDAVTFESMKQALEEKEVEVIQPKEVAPVEEAEKPQVIEEVDLSQKSWDGFLEYLFEHGPALASSLEQGNFLETSVISKEKINCSIGFTESSAVFFEVLEENTFHEKLKKFLSEYFHVQSDNIQITLNKIDEEDDEFSSIAEIHEINEEKEKEQLRTDIKENEQIIGAQELFNAKIDKIVLHRENP